MKLYTALLAALTLTGCQAATTDPMNPPDVSRIMTDPGLKAQTAEEYRSRQVASRAMKVHCQEKWSTDQGMIEYCVKTATPAMLTFIKRKAIFDTSNKKSGAWKAEVAYLSKCQTAYWGDFEMALACADNERAVKVLSR